MNISYNVRFKDYATRVIARNDKDISIFEDAVRAVDGSAKIRLTEKITDRKKHNRALRAIMNSDEVPVSVSIPEDEYIELRFN